MTGYLRYLKAGEGQGREHARGSKQKRERWKFERQLANKMHARCCYERQQALKVAIVGWMRQITNLEADAVGETV
jgi:hypothetical protein